MFIFSNSVDSLELVQEMLDWAFHKQSCGDRSSQVESITINPNGCFSVNVTCSNQPVQMNDSLEFSLNAFTEFAEFSAKKI